MSDNKCSGCAFANFRFNDAPVGSGRSTFLCTKHNEYRTYGDTDCGEWENRFKEATKMSKELFVEEGYNGAKYYDKDAVDSLLAEKEKDIAYWREEYDKETKLTDALKAEIESLKASHYAEMVDAGMRERRLRRALWIARAMRARDIQRWWISATCAPITERACSVWNNVERKCRAKAEEYK